ncbi:hypothetical protein DRQ33_07040 [bacterium]|nr:MAG: hypothetical protein DRQ33_07040 [bacterium]
MWALFWRLIAAHLFAEFPLGKYFFIANKNRTKYIIIHTAMVLLTTVLVISQLAFYRPILFLILPIITFTHILVDYIKTIPQSSNARVQLILSAGEQLTHIGVYIIIAVIFGWMFNYGSPAAFFRLSIAIFVIWANPHFVHSIRCAIKNLEKVSSYKEPFERFAFVERTVLFLGLSANSIWFIIAGLIIPSIIRGLLISNQENVPIPVFEWIITIVCAIIPRLIFGPIIFF